jgi:hypothetical protein
VPGAYAWLRGNVSAERQLAAYLNRVDAVGGPDGLITGIDVEDTESPPSVGLVCDWLAGFHELYPAHRVEFYSGPWWYEPHFGTAKIANPYTDLWNSNYGANPPGYASAIYAGVPASRWAGYGGWSRATLLQFTSRARIGGLSEVDCSAFEGTFADLQALAGIVPAGRGGITVNLSDNLPTPQWLKSAFPDDAGLANGLTVQTCLMSGYGHSRVARKELAADTAALLAALAELKTTTAALSATVTKLASAGTSVDTAAVLAAVNDAAAGTRTLVEALQDELAAAHDEIAALRAKLAAAGAGLAS